MVKIRYRKVLLEKNERFSTPLAVAPWEVPVLIEAHSTSLITDTGETIVNRKAVPDARAEFERLVNRYKHGENSEVPYVARVYGVSAIAVKVIEKMIRESIVGAETAPVEDLPDAASDCPVEEGVEEISDFDFDFASGQAAEAVEEISPTS